MGDKATTVAELRELVREFVAERDWHSYHDAKNLSMAIAIEAAELMEHFQWLRTDELAAAATNAKLRGQISDEMADIACFLLAMANVMGIELSDAIRQKMVKNRAKYPAEEFRGRYFKPGEQVAHG